MKSLAYIMISLGFLAIPAGYTLYPAARRMAAIQQPDGTLVLTDPAAGFWVVILSVFAALLLLVAGLVGLRLAARAPRTDNPQEDPDSTGQGQLGDPT